MSYAASLGARSEASARTTAALVHHPETSSQVRLVTSSLALRSSAAVAVAAMAALGVVPVAAEVEHQPYVWERHDWSLAACARIHALFDLADNWNGQGAARPNDVARDLAVQLVGLATTNPERIVPIPDGGIALYFVSPQVLLGGAPQKYARFACDNDGEIVLLLHDRQTGSSDVSMVGPDDGAIRVILDALDRADGFLA